MPAPAPPAQAAPKTYPCSVRLTPEQWAWVENQTQHGCIGVSHVVRLAVQAAMERAAA